MSWVDEETAQPSFKRRFFNIVCAYHPQLFYVMLLQIVLILMLTFSLFFIEPGTISYTMIQLDFIILGLTSIPTLMLLYQCSQCDWNL